MHHPNFCCAGKIFFSPSVSFTFSLLSECLERIHLLLNAGNVFLPPHTSVLLHLKMKATNS